MVFHYRSIQTVVVFSLLISGRVSKLPWAPIFPSVPLSTLNQVVRWKGSTKFSKTCLELALSHSVWIGRSVFLSPSLLITIATNPVSRELLLRFCMDEDVEHL